MRKLLGCASEHRPIKAFLLERLPDLWAQVPRSSLKLAKTFLSIEKLPAGEAEQLRTRAQAQALLDEAVPVSTDDLSVPLLMVWVQMVSKALGKPTAEERGIANALKQGHSSPLDPHVRSHESIVAYAERVLTTATALRIIGENIDYAHA